MKAGDRVRVTVEGDRVAATVVEPFSPLGNVYVELDVPVVDFDELYPERSIHHVYRDQSDVTPLLVDETVGGDGTR